MIIEFGFRVISRIIEASVSVIANLCRQDMCGRSVIEGAHIHILGFKNRKNNQFTENKLIRHSPNI